MRVLGSLITIFLLLVVLDGAAVANTFGATIQNLAFSPRRVTIEKDDSVTWTNRDAVQHQVVIPGGSTSPVLGQGESFTFLFAIPGTWDYACGIHPSMTGTVIVTTPSPTATPTPPPSTPRPTVPATATPTPTPTPTPSASPSPTASASATPAPSASLTPSPSATPVTAPASQTTQVAGLALIATGFAILGGAFWWRFGERAGRT